MSEDENDIEGVSSKEFSIDYKEMQNKYYKSIAMVIIAPIIVTFVFYNMGFFFGLLSISILILIEFYGLFGIITYKFRLKQKLSEETKIPDEDLKINYYKSILLVIFTPILFIYASIFYFTGFFAGVISMFPIGFIICFYGLYGIYSYKFKPRVKIMSEDKKDKYHKSITIAIIGAIITIIFGVIIIVGLTMNSHLASTNPLYYDVSLIGLFLILPIGIAICFYGLSGIYSYKFKPRKHKEAFEKRKKGENRRIVYYLLIAISLPIFILSAYYLIAIVSHGIEYLFWNIPILFVFILFLSCVIFGINKLIRGRRTKSS